jgi:hypothetical protein
MHLREEGKEGQEGISSIPSWDLFLSCRAAIPLDPLSTEMLYADPAPRGDMAILLPPLTAVHDSQAPILVRGGKKDLVKDKPMIAVPGLDAARGW